MTMQNTIRNISHSLTRPSAAQPIAPRIIVAAKIAFFFRPLSAAAPRIGPRIATRIVEMEMV